MKRKMTKADVVKMCREVFKEDPTLFRGDVTAQREYFNNITDAMCKEQVITVEQYESWTNPF